MGNGFKVMLIILLSIIAIALTCILGFLIVRGTKFNFNISSKVATTLVDEKTIEDIKDLKIDVNYSNIEIVKGSKENIDVKIYSDNVDTYKIEEEDDYISIVHKEKNSFYAFFTKLFSKNPKVIISLPSDYDKNIGIKGDVADVKMASFEDASAVINLNVGDIDIKKIDKLSIDLSTGDLDVDKVNDANVVVKTGDLDFGEINKSIDFKTNVGDIKIGKVNIEESGTITLNTGDVKISSVNDIYVDASTNVGDTKINDGNRKSDIVLKIKNNVGSIKVG